MIELPIFELIMLLLIFITVIFVVWFSKKNEIQPQESDDPYSEALELIIDGKERHAMQKLKSAVRLDTENLMAYVRLGDLLRKRQLYSNAIRIHKDLVFRNGLTVDEKVRIHQSLFLDYFFQEMYSEAIESAEFVIKFDKTPESAFLIRLLTVFEKSQNWQKAIDLLEKFPTHFSDEKNRIAHYLTFLGESESDIEKARALFTDAIAADPKCVAAHFSLGKSFAEADMLEEAIKAWLKIVNNVPEKAALIYPFLEKAWFSLDKYFLAENMYSEAFNNDNSNLEAGLALSKIYHKKGKTYTAVDILEQLEETHQKSTRIQEARLEFLFSEKQYKSAAELGLKALRNLHGSNTHYKCSACNNESQIPQWLCPNCQTIFSYGV